MTDLGAFISGGNVNSWAYDINNAEQVMIESDSGPVIFVYSGGEIISIPPPSDASAVDALRMNDSGQVVGESENPISGFFYSGGTTIDLNTLGLSILGSPITVQLAFDINDSGSIVISGWPEVYLLTPTTPRQITIGSITGWTLGGSAEELVWEAKWQGQPSYDKTANTNIYDDFYAIDVCQGPTSPCKIEGTTTPIVVKPIPYWTLNGQGFCPPSGCPSGQFGQIVFSDSNISPVTVPVGPAGWMPNSITFTPSFAPSGSFQYTTNPGVTVTITTPDGIVSGPLPLPPPQLPPGEEPPWLGGAWYGGVIATIDGRGYGQCTWYVANQRLAQGLGIPYPSAYTSTPIDASYVPQQWDVIDFTTLHTAIIISPVTKTTSPGSNGDTLITYNFTIGEMNVGTCLPNGGACRFSAWSEEPSSVDRPFVITRSPTGEQSVQTPIYSLDITKTCNGHCPATAYFH